MTEPTENSQNDETSVISTPGVTTPSAAPTESPQAGPPQPGPPHSGPPQSGPPHPGPAQQPYPPAPPGWAPGGQAAPGPQFPGWGPTGGPGQPSAYRPGAYEYAPQGPSFVERVGIENVLSAASIFFGVVTYFMGAVSWLVVPDTVDRQLRNWSEEQAEGVGVPAFLSYEMVLNPGWFFLLLGTVAVGAGVTLMPRWRHLLPFLAFGATAGWLGLLAGIMVLPPFVEVGVGAILALIFGFIQVALLVAATVLSGRQQK